MNKKVLYGSFGLNVLCLIFMILIHLYDSSHCICKNNCPKTNKEDNKTNNQVVCTLNENDLSKYKQVSTAIHRVVIDYDSYGVVTRYRIGSELQYIDDATYKSAKDNTDNETMEDLGNKTIYFYEDAAIKVSNEGKEFNLWVHSLSMHYQEAGYQCK